MLNAIKFVNKVIIVWCVIMGAAYAKSPCCPSDLQLPAAWQPLAITLEGRVGHTEPNLNLSDNQVDSLVDFLETANATPELQNLQKQMPQSTLQLLIAVQANKVTNSNANEMAGLLLKKYCSGGNAKGLDLQIALQIAKAKDLAEFKKSLKVS